MLEPFLRALESRRSQLAKRSNAPIAGSANNNKLAAKRAHSMENLDPNPPHPQPPPSQQASRPTTPRQAVPSSAQPERHSAQTRRCVTPGPGPVAFSSSSPSPFVRASGIHPGAHHQHNGSDPGILDERSRQSVRVGPLTRASARPDVAHAPAPAPATQVELQRAAAAAVRASERSIGPGTLQRTSAFRSRRSVPSFHAAGTPSAPNLLRAPR